jgi:hypothetical protein
MHLRSLFHFSNKIFLPTLFGAFIQKYQKVHKPLQQLQQGFLTYGLRPYCGSKCAVGKVAKISLVSQHISYKCILARGVIGYVLLIRLVT